MRVTLAQIEAFDRIVETGTFHAAARQLGVTQSTISHRIRELESALGVTLFMRRGPRCVLTAEGHALVDLGRRMLVTLGELGAHFGQRDELAGIVRLGVPNMFGILCMGDLLQRVEQRFPRLKVSVRLNDSVTLERMLEDGELDVAILNEPRTGSRMRHHAAGRTEHAWLAARSMRTPRVLHPADLAGMHVFVPPPPSRLHSMVSAWFAAAGIKPTRISTCNNFGITLDMIARGLAIAALPLRVLNLESVKGRLRRLDVVPPLPASRMTISHQARSLGPAVEVVVPLMRELIGEHRVFDD